MHKSATSNPVFRSRVWPRVLRLAVTLLLCVGVGCQSKPTPEGDGVSQPTSLEHQSLRQESRVPKLEQVGAWERQPPEILLPDSLADFPWMKDVSAYASQWDYAQGDPPRRLEGAFGMGNGRVFGILGLGTPMNTLCNHTGPAYQASEDFFGDLALFIRAGGARVNFAHETVFRVRGTAIHGTQAQLESGLELTTVDLVPPDQDALLRTLVVKNRSTQVQTDLSVEVALTYSAQEAPEAVDAFLVQHRAGRSLYLTALEPDLPHLSGSTLRIPVGTLGPDEERRVTVALAYTNGPEPGAAQAIVAELNRQGLPALLETTRAHWTDWLAGAAVLSTPSQAVNDLYEGMQVAIGVQTDSQGVVSPMSRYSKAWLRDTYGPLRFFTRIGRTHEAAAMLDYLYKTSILTHELRNSVVLGVDTRSVSAPSDPESFWQSATLMPGRNPVEAPSYLLLSTDALYRATDDLELIRERYEYLKAAVTLQERGADGTMEFSGDETFRYTLMLAMSAVQDPVEIAWSANSNLAWLAAAQRLEAFATVLGKTADASSIHAERSAFQTQTDALYWRAPEAGVGYYAPALRFRNRALVDKPFEDVSTKALFFGTLEGSSERARTLVDTLVTKLMRDDGTLLTPDGLRNKPVPGYTGMVPGLFLTNVALADHPEGARVFNALDLTVSPSGQWDETHWADHSAASVHHEASGTGGGETAARFRPWEGGENIDAMVLYLTGLELDLPARTLRVAPHLPNGWTSLSLNQARAGTLGQYNLRFERSSTQWTAYLSSTLSAPLTVDLRFVEPATAFGTCRVNGSPWPEAQLKRETIYGTVARVTVQGVTLPPGGTLTVTAAFP